MERLARCMGTGKCMGNIAILGATSHIAKSCPVTCRSGDLHLFARNPVAVDGFVTQLGYSGIRPVLTFADFGQTEYAAVINCVGFGNPASLRDAGYSLFTVTGYYDSMILAYLENNPDCVYVNMSSGAVYRGAFAAPVGISTKSVFDVNALGPADFYALAKLHSEARHRAAPDLNIIDLRVFSFFSRHIDPGAGFLLSDIIACLLEKAVLTGARNVRTMFTRRTFRPCQALQRTVNCASMSTTVHRYKGETSIILQKNGSRCRYRMVQVR